MIEELIKEQIREIYLEAKEQAKRIATSKPSRTARKYLALAMNT